VPHRSPLPACGARDELFHHSVHKDVLENITEMNLPRNRAAETMPRWQSVISEMSISRQAEWTGVNDDKRRVLVGDWSHAGYSCWSHHVRRDVTDVTTLSCHLHRVVSR